MPGEMAGEGTAPTFYPFGLQRCIVALQCVFDDRKTETRTAKLARSARVHAIETFGEPRNVLLGNAHPRVAHGEMTAFRIGPPTHFDESLAWRVLHRIGEQVRDNRMNLALHSEQPFLAF